MPHPRITIAMLALPTLLLSGCGLIPRSQPTQHVVCTELIGVDDMVFHGHKKTCWRQWNDEAWAMYCCPVHVHVHELPAAHEIVPQEAVPQVPPVPSDADVSFHTANPSANGVQLLQIR